MDTDHLKKDKHLLTVTYCSLGSVALDCCQVYKGLGYSLRLSGTLHCMVDTHGNLYLYNQQNIVEKSIKGLLRRCIHQT